MKKNVLEFLESSSLSHPGKTAFTDAVRDITYSELLSEAKAVGTCLAKLRLKNKPIAILIDKNIDCLACMFGIVYSGNFYVVIDVKMPVQRINSILSTLQAKAVITDEFNLETARKLDFNGVIKLVKEAKNTQAEQDLLSDIRRNMIDTDPVYALFTSGSTGVPKGAVVSHKAVISYTSWATDTFGISDTTVFGSQTPFYFSMSVTDVYSTLSAAATFHIIPKSYFSFPLKLLEFLNQKEINTIYWVPSALNLIANWKALDAVSLPFIRLVLFAGEVMPTKQLNYWISHLPEDTVFANLFGPTETTDICTYYVVNRKFSDTEPLPIGIPCDNCGILIINDKNEEVPYGEEGELCVRGSFLAHGYYNNAEKTKDAFTLNPLNTMYPETIYRTGDIVRYNEFGELIYISRKDFQIKHMGYRIELGEIESNINALDGIISCACVYNTAKEKIVLFYQGNNIDNNDIISFSRQNLPEYMIPNKIIKLDQIPINANGKIDRVHLKSLL